MKKIIYKSTVIALCILGLIGCNSGGSTSSSGSSSEPHIHNYSEWEYLNKDQHKRFCYLCNEDAEGHYEITNHNWDDGVLVNPATHTKKGLKIITCSDCHATKNEELPCLTEHIFDKCIASPSYLKEEATCHSSAIYYKSCICGVAGQETFTHGEPTVHNLTSLTISGIPNKSTYETGEKFDPTGLNIAYTCADCDHSNPIDYKSLVSVYPGNRDCFRVGDTSVTVCYGNKSQVVNGITVVKSLNTIFGVQDLTINCCDKIDLSKISCSYGDPKIVIKDKNNATVLDYSTLDGDCSPYTMTVTSSDTTEYLCDIKTATITVNHDYHFNADHNATMCNCGSKYIDRYYYDLSRNEVNYDFVTGVKASEFDPSEVYDAATMEAPDWTNATVGTNKLLLTNIDDKPVFFEGTVVTSVLKTKQSVIDFGNSIYGTSKDEFGGYYVLGTDVNLGGTSITHYDSQAGLGAPYFTGTFDGADHQITGDCWGHSLFGFTKKSTFKNLTIKNVNAKGLFLIIDNNVTFENVLFDLEGEINYQGSDLGSGAYLCKEFGKSNSIINCTFKYGTHTNSIIANASFGDEASPTVFKNTKVYCLPTTKLFTSGEGERPTSKGITYVSINNNVKLFYDTSKDAVVTSEVEAGLPGYHFSLDEQGTPIDWANRDIGKEFTVYALKDGEETYMIPAVKATRVITGWQDYQDWASNRTSTADKGYYVQTADFVYGSDANVMNGAYEFRGTYDGRGHKITYTLDWNSNNGLFGKVLNPAKIMNLTVDGINRPYAIGYEINNSTITNCTFIAASTIDRTGLGLLCNTAQAFATFVDVTIKCGTLSATDIYAIAETSSSTTYPIRYTNVTIECLSSVNAIKTANDGKGNRPTEINFINTNP